MSTERQDAVELQTLLSKLSDNGVRVQEFTSSRRVTGTKLYLLSWQIDPFPFCEREWAWYPLIIKDGQTEIDRETADAVLRHVWHSVMPFFDDELQEQIKPQDSHEDEIAKRVDDMARAVGDGKWESTAFDDLISSLTFEPSESETDYLELRLHWRQEIPIKG